MRVGQVVQVRTARGGFVEPAAAAVSLDAQVTAARDFQPGAIAANVLLPADPARSTQVTFAAANGLPRVTLLADKDNAPALAFYERLGFEYSAMRVLRRKVPGRPLIPFSDHS